MALPFSSVLLSWVGTTTAALLLPLLLSRLAPKALQRARSSRGGASKVSTSEDKIILTDKEATEPSMREESGETGMPVASEA